MNSMISRVMFTRCAQKRPQRPRPRRSLCGRRCARSDRLGAAEVGRRRGRRRRSRSLVTCDFNVFP